MEMGKGEGWAPVLKEKLLCLYAPYCKEKFVFFYSTIHTTALPAAKWAGFPYQGIL